MRRNPLHITVEQARAVMTFAPGDWLLIETPEGWIAKRGNATLIGINSRTPRIFKNLERAVRRLQQEAGARNFKVETMPLPPDN